MGLVFADIDSKCLIQAVLVSYTGVGDSVSQESCHRLCSGQAAHWSESLHFPSSIMSLNVHTFIEFLVILLGLLHFGKNK